MHIMKVRNYSLHFFSIKRDFYLRIGIHHNYWERACTRVNYNDLYKLAFLATEQSIKFINDDIVCYCSYAHA